MTTSSDIELKTNKCNEKQIRIKIMTVRKKYKRKIHRKEMKRKK